MVIGGVTVGLREAVIVLIVVVACYMAFVVLRMRHLRKPSPAPVEQVPAAVAAYTAVADNDGDEDDEVVPTQPPPVVLGDHLLVQGLEREVAQLREEVDAVRGELAALREDMFRELGQLRATQSVSPIYGDAMQMAVAGYDAAMIAERCGIARAEAELVAALAKSQER